MKEKNQADQNVWDAEPKFRHKKSGKIYISAKCAGYGDMLVQLKDGAPYGALRYRSKAYEPVK